MSSFSEHVFSDYHGVCHNTSRVHDENNGNMTSFSFFLNEIKIYSKSYNSVYLYHVSVKPLYESYLFCWFRDIGIYH